ncbi:MAG: RDD family protein, partial [Thermoplasmatota archaeon]
FLCVLFAAILLSADLSSGKVWSMVLIVSGIINWFVKSVMEGMKGESIGKGIMGLKVIDAYGKVTVGGSLVRNLFEVVPVILPILDYVIGTAVARDSRQKLFDSISRTLVVEDLPEEVKNGQAPLSRGSKARPEPREKIILDFREVRVGHCPRCGASYRVVPPDDTSFSGLWNHRCTWCNELITEDH